MIPIKYDQDFVISLFCIIDDLLKLLFPLNHISNKRGRKNKLVCAEVLTLGILFISSNCDSFSQFLRCTYFDEIFNLNEYSRLLRKVKDNIEVLILLMVVICHFNRQNCHWLKFIDSIPVKVVSNKRIFTYTSSNKAGRGKSSIGWFYGFKVHLIVDYYGNILNFRITSGNTSDIDKDVINQLLKEIEGVVVGDKAYQSKELFKKLNELKIYWLTGIKKSVKNINAIVFEGYHQLKKLRQGIETINGQIKYRQGMETSTPRSTRGYMYRYLYAIFSYMIFKQFLGSV